jgi:hypothetical protein
MPGFRLSAPGEPGSSLEPMADVDLAPFAPPLGAGDQGSLVRARSLPVPPLRLRHLAAVRSLLFVHGSAAVPSWRRRCKKFGGHRHLFVMSVRASLRHHGIPWTNSGPDRRSLPAPLLMNEDGGGEGCTGARLATIIGSWAAAGAELQDAAAMPLSESSAFFALLLAAVAAAAPGLEWAPCCGPIRSSARIRRELIEGIEETWRRAFRVHWGSAMARPSHCWRGHQNCAATGRSTDVQSEPDQCEHPARVDPAVSVLQFKPTRIPSATCRMYEAQQVISGAPRQPPHRHCHGAIAVPSTSTTILTAATAFPGIRAAQLPRSLGGARSCFSARAAETTPLNARQAGTRPSLHLRRRRAPRARSE